MHVPKKIPTVVGLLMVLIIVSVMAVGSNMYYQTTTSASGSIAPTDVTITNVNDTLFSVSWTTETPATGAVSVSGSGGSRVLYDEQDTVNAQGKYLNHSITYRSANPDTSYNLTILSNGKKFLDNNKPYAVRTAPHLTTSSGNLDPAYGVVVNPDKTPVKGALVYVTLEGGQTLSAITKPSGTWLVPLNLTRTKDLSSFLPITERMTVNIIVKDDGRQATAITDTLNDSPTPEMIIGSTHDFRRLNAKAPGEPVALLITPAAPKSGTVMGTTTKSSGTTVSLTIPAEGAALPTTLPLIQGTGIPGKTVSIILGITAPIGGTAIVAKDGVWTFTPKKPIAPGRQSVTITTQDKNNKPVAMTHSFTILKSGTQVLGDATPSGTLTPTITDTPEPTATPAAEPTEDPEATLAAQPPPSSGNTLPTILLIMLGIGLIVGGVLTYIPIPSNLK